MLQVKPFGGAVGQKRQYHHHSQVGKPLGKHLVPPRQLAQKLRGKLERQKRVDEVGALMKEGRKERRSQGAAEHDANGTAPSALTPELVCIGKEQRHHKPDKREEHHRVPWHHEVLLVVVKRQKRRMEELSQASSCANRRGGHRAIQ